LDQAVLDPFEMVNPGPVIKAGPFFAMIGIENKKGQGVDAPVLF